MMMTPHPQCLSSILVRSKMMVNLSAHILFSLTASCLEQLWSRNICIYFMNMYRVRQPVYALRITSRWLIPRVG